MQAVHKEFIIVIYVGLKPLDEFSVKELDQNDMYSMGLRDTHEKT